jgi:hypothetical protein
MKYGRIFAAIAFVSIVFEFGHAFSKDECSDVLVEKSVSFEKKGHVALSYYYRWSRERFDEEKKNFDTGGGGIIYGMYVESDTSYEEFRDHLDKEAKSVGYKYEQEEATSFLTSGLPSENVNAWLTCMRKENEPLILWVEDLTDEGATVLLEYVPGYSITQGVTATPDLDNISNTNLDKLKGTWDQRRAHTLWLKRTNPGKLAGFSLSKHHLHKSWRAPCPRTTQRTMNAGRERGMWVLTQSEPMEVRA